jgi:uncharacterized membrane protein
VLVALVAVGAWATGAVLSVEGPVRIGFGLLITTAVPGYAVTAAIFAPARPRGSDGVLMTLSLSVSVVILTGFVLNASGILLRPQTWATALAGLSLAAAAFAWVRSPSSAPHARPVLGSSRRVPSLADATVMLMSGVLVIAAIGLANIGAIKQPTEPFSALWLIPNDAASQALVGVRNDEGRPMVYRLVLESSTSTIEEWPMVDLADSEQWQATVALAKPPTYLELRLYRADQPTVVYRRVSWGAVPTATAGDAAP